MIANPVIVRVMHHGFPCAITRQFNRDRLGNLGKRPIAHEQNAVRQKNGFVDIMGDHEYGLARFTNNGKELVLYRAAGQSIQSTEGLVEQQHLGLNGKGSGDAHPLLHAAGKFGRLFVCRMAKAHHLQVAAAVVLNFQAAPLRPPGAHTERYVLERCKPWQQGMALKHDAAIE